MDHATRHEETIEAGSRRVELATEDSLRSGNEYMAQELKVRMSIIHSQEAHIKRLEADIDTLKGRDTTSNG